jgi:hypothetical protein
MKFEFLSNYVKGVNLEGNVSILGSLTLENCS